jgi:hypothetical protein
MRWPLAVLARGRSLASLSEVDMRPGSQGSRLADT